MNYAPIHNHSEYSALDGLSTCREIAERCQEIGVEAVGITDHGTVSGHLEFGKVMAEHSIKPIYGCELYHGVKTEFGKNERDQAHFVAGAKTDEGLRNLWRLVDRASTNFRFVGRVEWSMLREHSEGLFATSACIQGLVSKGVRDGDTDALNQYLEIFGDDFYIELHTYPGTEHEVLNGELVRLARERGIGLVYATDAHFASPDQYEVHDAYVAMQTGETIMLASEDRKMWHPKSLYIQDAAQIRTSLAYLPDDVVEEALTNTGELAAKCNAELPPVKRHLPIFVPRQSPWVKDDDGELSSQELFFQEVEKGIEARYGNSELDVPVPHDVWDRAAIEIEVFLKAGLEHYFLQAWDFCQFCEENGIRRGPGRGSAAGSIVAYALGITDIDPLKYELVFERFYNPGREKGFPDIDCDFPTKARDQVKKYMETRWGKNRVRSIGTITRLKPKAAIDRTYKVCGISFTEKEALKKIIDTVPDLEILGPDSIGWDEEIDPGKTIYVKDHVGAEISEWRDSFIEDDLDRIDRWLSLLRMVCSRVSGYGVHPSGVVVSDVDLDDELPCMWNSKKKTQVTCFAMSDVDARRFVKNDFLGLRNLDILDEWEDMVTPLVGEIDWKDAENDHDPAMWHLLDQGFTQGIFQIEDGYARHLAKELKPRSIEDLGIIVALNRPGPIRSGAPESFIARKNGDEEITYDHPILEDILEPTYGWFLYQEQVIAFFEKIGLNKSDADEVRKILGKKKPEAMRELRNGTGEWAGKGYFALAENSGVDPKAAKTIWEKLEDFAKYSFNKSHAICYGTVAFRTLYAKYCSPRHFYIAAIQVTNSSTIQDKLEKVAKFVGESRRMKILVLPPDIARSGTDIAIYEDHIYFGFSNVKGVGKGASDLICSLRESHLQYIHTPEDLFHALEVEQKVWEHSRDMAKDQGKPFKKKSPRQTLRANQIPLLHQVGAFDEHDPRKLALKEIQRLEKELLGVILTDNCEEVFQDNWEAVENCDSYPELELSEDGHKLYVPGIVSSVVPKRTRKDGKAMGIVTIEYQGDQAEFVVFPREWKSYKYLWAERTPAIFGLCKTDRGVRFDQALRLK